LSFFFGFGDLGEGVL